MREGTPVHERSAATQSSTFQSTCYYIAPDMIACPATPDCLMDNTVDL